MMDMFVLLVFSGVVFMIFYVLALLLADCDFALAWAEKFGKPIGTFIIFWLSIAVQHPVWLLNVESSVVKVLYP